MCELLSGERGQYTSRDPKHHYRLRLFPEPHRPVFGLKDIMRTPNENSSDPQVHSARIQQQLEDLIQHARADIGRVSEPRFQALLETTARVLAGLKTAFQHYGEKREQAGGGG